MIDSKIKNRLKELKLTQKEFCDLIGMSASGFRQAIGKKTLSIGKLEEISNALRVPMGYWFTYMDASATVDTHLIFDTLEKIVIREILNNK